MQGAKGSKMPRGDKEQILRYEMPILSCSEESIGTFFLNLDQKIRLNEQINQNLPLPDHSLREARVRHAA